jgi:hypothetical protein
MPSHSSRPWMAPSSPKRPCSARKATSMGARGAPGRCRAPRRWAPRRDRGSEAPAPPPRPSASTPRAPRRFHPTTRRLASWKLNSPSGSSSKALPIPRRCRAPRGPGPEFGRAVDERRTASDADVVNSPRQRVHAASATSPRAPLATERCLRQEVGRRPDERRARGVDHLPLPQTRPRLRLAARASAALSCRVVRAEDGFRGRAGTHPQRRGNQPAIGADEDFPLPLDGASENHTR